jgi:hypothetical protein
MKHTILKRYDSQCAFHQDTFVIFRTKLTPPCTPGRVVQHVLSERSWPSQQEHSRNEWFFFLLRA